MFCLPTHPPAGATATVRLSPASGARQPLTAANATVTFHPASVVSDPDYVQQLSWQGHTKSVVEILRREAPGVYRTIKPLPLAGSWKSLIRIQQGRVRADVPVYLPADPAIPAAAVPAARVETRALIADTTLMQRERKRDVPGVVVEHGDARRALDHRGARRDYRLGSESSGGARSRWFAAEIARARRAWSRPAPVGAGR